MFIQAHNDREMARLVREGASITFVSSFLRSGSTWMCYLLCDILMQNQGIQTATEMPVDRKRIILDHYARLIVRRDTSVQTAGCMIKTHDLIPELQRRIGGDPAPICRRISHRSARPGTESSARPRQYSHPRSIHCH